MEKLTKKETQLFQEALKQVQFNDRLLAFARESNRIEGIDSAHEHESMQVKLEYFLKLEKLTPEDVKAFNEWGELRIKPMMDVRIGNRETMKGGPLVGVYFNNLIKLANNHDAYSIHKKFEWLHPFMDGNGRTGRAVWLWRMVNKEGYNLERGFLHEWYYQTL